MEYRTDFYNAGVVELSDIILYIVMALIAVVTIVLIVHDFIKGKGSDDT